MSTNIQAPQRTSLSTLAIGAFAGAGATAVATLGLAAGASGSGSTALMAGSVLLAPVLGGFLLGANDMPSSMSTGAVAGVGLLGLAGGAGFGFVSGLSAPGMLLAGAATGAAATLLFAGGIWAGNHVFGDS